jgi:hypothetical protein
MVAHRLNNITKQYNLKISTLKTKSMGMCGSEILRLKVMTEGKRSLNMSQNLSI